MTSGKRVDGSGDRAGSVPDETPSSEGTVLDVEEIARLLPHRFPFLLLDRVVHLEPGRRIVAIKNVTANDPFFLGHFPGRPVMPGVLLCEALAQAGAVLAQRSGEGIPAGSVLLLTGLDRARFRRPVVPGDQVRLEVVSVHRRAPLWRMRGVAAVEGERVAEVDFSAAEVVQRPAAGGPRGAEVRIHPMAMVAPGAELDFDVEVGPYAVIGPDVRVGRGTWIGPHTVVEGRTQVGSGNRIFQFTTVGSIPQDLKYRGEPSSLIIGDHNTIREFASLNPGTEGGGMETRLGDHNLIMMGAHVAHDCRVGSYAILANGATLGGHVTIEDYVIVGGLVGIHQFVRIGESAIVGGGSMVSQDVPPYCNATGDRARLRGLNIVGLRRRGFGREQMRALKRAYRTLFLSGLPRAAAVAQTRAELGHIPEIERLIGFVEQSKRGISRATGGEEAPEGE